MYAFWSKNIHGVSKYSDTIKTQRCLSTKNISWNHVDQNGGHQKRDLRLISAEGYLLQNIDQSFETNKYHDFFYKKKNLDNWASKHFPPFWSKVMKLNVVIASVE